MTVPQRNWWLGIVLAFLLVHSSCATTDEEDPYIKYTGNGGINEKYEVIDVAHEKIGAGKAQSSGQTTHVYTNGEVDDDFWLKHLGEDFKNAIHLQVGGNDQFDGMFNMTDDSTRYEVHHQFGPHASPVQRPAMALNYPTEKTDAANVQQYQTEKNKNGTDLMLSSAELLLDKSKEKSTEASSEEVTEQTPTATNNSTVDEPKEKHDEPFEQIFSIHDNDEEDAFKLASRFYNPNAFNLFDESQKDDGYSKYTQYTKETHDTPKKYTNTHYKNTNTNSNINSNTNSNTNTNSNMNTNINSNSIQNSNTNSNINTNTNSNTNTNINANQNSNTNTNLNTNTNTNSNTKTNTNKNTNKYTDDGKSPFSTVMVNLPERQKTVVQLDDTEEPVVVKMPPVIYHQNPKFSQDDTETYSHAHINPSTKKHPTERRFSTRFQHQQNAYKYKSQSPHKASAYKIPNFDNPPPFEEAASFESKFIYAPQLHDPQQNYRKMHHHQQTGTATTL